MKNKPKYLIFCILIVILSNVQANSQYYFWLNLKWEYADPNKLVLFEDTCQIVEYCKGDLHGCVPIQSKSFRIKGTDVFVVAVNKCSGVYCPHIFIFKRKNIRWQMVATTVINHLNRKLEIEMDENQKKILFLTESGMTICDLPYEKLDLDSGNEKQYSPEE